MVPLAKGVTVPSPTFSALPVGAPSGGATEAGVGGRSVRRARPHRCPGVQCGGRAVDHGTPRSRRRWRRCSPRCWHRWPRCSPRCRHRWPRCSPRCRHRCRTARCAADAAGGTARGAGRTAGNATGGAGGRRADAGCAGQRVLRRILGSRAADGKAAAMARPLTPAAAQAILVFMLGVLRLVDDGDAYVNRQSSKQTLRAGIP